uniref:Xylanolytic transcriptional activator regulatory domain-containing protein n=1 Tax=Bionectria ochroleuca TaxID=29856 RepID=A0A8H7NQ91_BIOOC
MPLFQEKVFDKVLFASYNHSTTAWSAILAISAIGIRMTIPGKGLAAASDLPQSANADQYACKALSVAFDLASTSGNILAVQVLVALAMFFTCMGNMEKASALIAMAVNLAHRLQLYSKHSAQYMQKEVAEQRHRVFWVLFSLEKTISYQTTRPSMLAGAEIDIPPPSNHPLDGNGIVWSRDRRSSLNYFRKTLDLSLVLSELSHIHSIASGSEGWATRLSRTRTTLENWYKSIPLEFQLDNVLSNAREEDRMQLTKFYHAYIFALLSMHCFFSPKAKWMLRLSQHGREAAQSYATETIGFRAVRCLSQCEPPLLKPGACC